MQIVDYTRRDKFVKAATDIALDDSHGYSQLRRWGPAYDCSSLTYTAAYLAGYNLPHSDPRYTGTLERDFVAAGWRSVPYDGNLNDLDPGDILLNRTHHVAVCIGNNNLVEGYGASNGGVDDGDNVDSTGWEIRIAPLYNYWAGWDVVLTPPVDVIEVPDPEKRQAHLWDYHGGDNQLFRLIHNADGSVTIVDKKYGLALDLDRGITDNGTPVNFYTPNGLDPQKWYIVQDLDGPSEPKNIAPYVLVSKLGYNKVLDAATPDGGKNGNALVLYDNFHETNKNQLWFIEDRLDGFVSIRSVLWPSKVLDAGSLI